MQKEKVKDIVVEGFRLNNLCAMFVDVQSEVLEVGYGFYLDALESCETLRQTLTIYGIPRIWTVFAELAGNTKMTAREFSQRASVRQNFNTVIPSTDDLVFNKNRRDACVNQHLVSHMKDTHNNAVVLFAGFFSHACYRATAISMLRNNPDIRIVIVPDATDIESSGWLDAYIDSTFDVNDKGRVFSASTATIDKWLTQEDPRPLGI